ncbi:MAG TPA: hypothetical protein VF047_04795 [Nitrososphaeraceae archaeon]
MKKSINKSYCIKALEINNRFSIIMILQNHNHRYIDEFKKRLDEYVCPFPNH